MAFCRSAFCSLNIGGRTTMITPTPRAMSPQDIVRIYVPPAPLDEQTRTNHDTPKHNKQNSRSPSTKDSKPNSLPASEVKYPNSNNYNSNNNNNYSNNNANHNNTNANKNNNNNNNHCTNDNNHKKIMASHEKLSASVQKVSPSSHQSAVAAAATAAAASRRPPNTLTGLESGSNRNSIIYGSGDLTPVYCAFNRSEDDLTKSFADASLSTNSNSLGYIGASSSSRRGSLSRKSPSAMFESNMLMECSHMLKRRLSNSSINYEVVEMQPNAGTVTRSGGDIVSSSLSLRLNSPSSNSNSNGGGGGVTPKRMTSFEQLAAARYKERQRHSHDGDADDDDDDDDDDGRGRKTNDENDKYSPDDEENYSYSYYKYRSADSRQRSPSNVESSKRFVSESNVQYESISMRQSSNEPDGQALNKRRPKSSGNETSLFQYEQQQPATSTHKSITTSIKEYKRFYGTSNEDTCDEENKKSSDESPSSPNFKSILNSPDTIPLLSLQLSPSPLAPSPHASSHIPIAKMKSPTTTTTAGVTDAGDSNSNAQFESPIKPSRIPIVHGGSSSSGNGNGKTMSKFSPTAHQITSPNSSDLNRVLPPIDIISSSSSSNNSLSSRKLLKSPPTSPNGQTIIFTTSTNRPTKLPSSKNGTATTAAIGDSNTIRIKVNQSDNQ